MDILKLKLAHWLLPRQLAHSPGRGISGRKRTARPAYEREAPMKYLPKDVTNRTRGIGGTDIGALFGVDP